MEHRKLGNLNVSVIGLGTLRSFDVTDEADLVQRRQIIDNCLSNDINFIDSAAMYGASEKAVGITTEGKRDKFYLATKVRIEGKEAGEQQIAQSFANLNVDYIDLFQIHNLIETQTHLPTLERLKGEGKIGMIGVTAMVDEAYPEIMDLMRSGRIDTVQIPYNVVQRTVEEGVLPLAEELGIGVMVMEPLKKGRYVKELKGEPDLTPLKEFGVQTWAQALLSWVVSDPRVSITIPATSRPERINENALSGNLGIMPQELRDYVREETVRLL
ncbi:MAG: aldo/keto reductase [SAR202 cluster bacterium]|nr:aldo/keto reductase [SAR202 cluster bacterium]